MLNKKVAFTLLEVMFAIVILAVTAIIFSRQHVRSALNVLKGREAIDRFFVIKKELSTNIFNPPKEGKLVVKEEEDLNLKLTTQILPVEKKSALKDFIDDIDLVQTKGEWITDLGISNIKMVGIVLKDDSEED